MKRFLSGLLVLTSLATPAAAGELRVVLLDCSGSVGDGERSPLEANRLAVKKLVLSTPKDSSVCVFGFGRRSFVPLLKVVSPKVAGPQGRNLTSTIARATAKLDENFSERRKEIDDSGTDVDGSLFRVSRIFAEEDRGRDRVLYVYSDMQDTEKLKIGLSSPATGDSKGRHASAPQSYPDLRGVKVHVFSSFADSKKRSTGDTERAVLALKNYWTRYFANAGAVLVEYRTYY